jgi:PmbA protein
MGINIVTGDFSRGGQGIWIQDGKLTFPVNEFTITSNFIEMMNNISMVGNDLIFLNKNNSPTFKVDKMTVSGV